MSQTCPGPPAYASVLAHLQQTPMGLAGCNCKHNREQYGTWAVLRGCADRVPWELNHFAQEMEKAPNLPFERAVK